MGWELYDIYTDEQSGSKSNRAGIQRLIKDAKANKFDVVITKELSRISRNGTFSYEFKDVLITHQIHLITLDGVINTLKDSISYFGLFAWLSEEEALRTSKRVKTSAQVRAKAGRFDEAPYGYDLKDGKLYISSDGSAEIVKRIFNEYIEGRSFDAIARSLSRENIPTPAARKGNKNAGKFWHGSTVRQILERQIYIGDLVAGKTTTISPRNNKRRINSEDEWIIVENTHEPIIEKDLFELVQQLITARKRIRSQQGTHLFTGYLTCGTCGAGMHFKRDRYVCGNQNKHGKIACSDNFRPKEKELTQSLLQDINSLYFADFKKQRVEKLLDSKLNSFKKKELSKEESLSIELEKLMQRKQKALEKLLDDKIDQEAYDGLIANLNPQIDRLKDELNELQSELKATNSNIDDLKNYVLEHLDLSEPLKELTPTILAQFIRKIIIKADGQLEVYYRTSKPSAFYVSINIKLAIPKSHPNKAYVKKHA